MKAQHIRTHRRHNDIGRDGTPTGYSQDGVTIYQLEDGRTLQVNEHNLPVRTPITDSAGNLNKYGEWCVANAHQYENGSSGRLQDGGRYLVI